MEKGSISSTAIDGRNLRRNNTTITTTKKAPTSTCFCRPAMAWRM